MNYNEILNFLYQRGFHTINLGLERIETLLRKLGNPEKELKVIHVAGTNGKGSVCAMCTSILMEAGYKTGLYTSPHLVEFTERFKINNKNIAKKRLVELFEQIKPHITNETYFEIITAMAFLYFKQEKVEIVVLEVGMGGRLDATNVIIPLVAVITTISKEHTQYLGDTIEKIAFEKAGIIKSNFKGNCYVVVGESNAALNVIKKICKERNAKLAIAKPTALKTSLKGEYQKINAGIAVEAIKALANYGNKMYKISDSAIVNGLLKAEWRGRLDFVERNVVLDCAHNPNGIECLVNELNLLKEQHKFNKFQAVFGAMKDKEIDKMIELLLPIASTFILTTPKGDWINGKWSMEERAEKPENIAKIIEDKTRNQNINKQNFNQKKFTQKNIFIIKNPMAALKKAKSLAKKDELVVVCGSCFLVGDIMRGMKKY